MINIMDIFFHSYVKVNFADYKGTHTHYMSLCGFGLAGVIVEILC